MVSLVYVEQTVGFVIKRVLENASRKEKAKEETISMSDTLHISRFGIYYYRVHRSYDYTLAIRVVFMS